MRLSEGVENGRLLLWEIRAQGYTGGYSQLRMFVKPHRLPARPKATIRFETKPAEQAQVDWGLFRYLAVDGTMHHLWAFSMVLSWCRALYAEFVQRADVAPFIRYHLHAFRYFGGVPAHCLCDNAKVAGLGRDEDGEPIWNERFFDFALRLDFDVRPCRPYRAQTNGRVQSAVKPAARYHTLPDLNRQALAWCDTVANVRLHGTTHERPVDRLPAEEALFPPLPIEERLVLSLTRERKMRRAGFVQWEDAFYGADVGLAGKTLELQATTTHVHIYRGNILLAVHPRALYPRQRFAAPGQRENLKGMSVLPRPEPLAVELPAVEIERRPLSVSDEVCASDDRTREEKNHLEALGLSEAAAVLDGWLELAVKSKREI